MKKIIYLLTLAATITACNSKDSFTVKGTVEDAKGKTLYFESIGMDRTKTLDSVKLGSDGEFKFKHPSTEYPEYYRLRLDNNNIDFAVDSTETISIEAAQKGFATNYFIEGSYNSKKMKLVAVTCETLTEELEQIQKKMTEGKIHADSAIVLFDKTVKTYKKQLNSLVFEDPKSTYAYYAIFQRVNGSILYNPYDKEDLKAIAAVATAHNFFTPESARSKQLYNMALEAIKSSRAANRQLVFDQANVASNIEIELPNIQGDKQKLSSLNGKVSLLNFTAYETDFSPALNIRLADLYRKYAAQGFDIFQVSLDANEQQWKVSASNLPWTCVRDEKGVNSRYMMLYNVTELPTIFILDRTGTVTTRVKSMASLEDEIKKLL